MITKANLQLIWFLPSHTVVIFILSFCSTVNADWQKLETSNLSVARNAKLLSWHDSLWCLSDDTLFNSSDGINWSTFDTTNPPSGSSNIDSLIHNNQFFLFSGSSGFVNLYVLSDINNWNYYGYVDRFWHDQDVYIDFFDLFSSLSFDGSVWILGGYYYAHYAPPPSYSITLNSVLRYWPGFFWQHVTLAPWPARAHHTSLVFDNKMWVLGGINEIEDPSSWRYYRHPLNDVWYSEDGESWIQATANAPWAPRFGHASVVFDNKMWILGGNTDEGNVNDVWCSEDGINWTQVSEAAPWSPRVLHSCTVHDNKIWLVGGSGPEGRLEDFWVYEPDAEGEGEAETIYHSADWHGKPDRRIDLTELLRIIQFYTSDGYSCAEPGDPLSDEGYLPGDGDRSCTPHAADYNPQDWRINLSELLRIIQFYNSGGYRACEDGEDGFCPEK